MDQLHYQNSQIVAIGEGHSWGEWEFIPKVTEKLRNMSTDYNCVFIETHSSRYIDTFLKAYDRFRANQSKENAIELAIQFVSNQNIISSEFIENLSLIKLHQAMVEFHEQGYKMFAVDKSDDSLDCDEEEFHVDCANERDEHMAKNARNLLSSKQCTKAIFPVGFAHISKFYASRKTLAPRFTDFQIDVSYVLMIRPGYDRTSEIDHVVWGGTGACNSLDLPERDVAIRSSNFKDNIYMAPPVVMDPLNKYDWLFFSPRE